MKLSPAQRRLLGEVVACGEDGMWLHNRHRHTVTAKWLLRHGLIDQHPRECRQERWWFAGQYVATDTGREAVS